MMVDSQKREYTQTVILALLVSQKRGCTLFQLERDYYEQEGESIPWKAFGYVSLLNFLQSMPKVVQIENRGSTFIIRGIASEKSKHVSSLVAGQKAQIKKYPAGRKNFRPSHYYPKTCPPRMYPIPANMLTMIVGLVNEHPDGVDKDYVFNVIQSRIPCANICMKDMEQQLELLTHKLFVVDNKVFPLQSKPKYLAEWNRSESLTSDKRQSKLQSNVNSDNQEQKTSIVTAGGNEEFADISDIDDDDDFYFVPSGYAPQSSSMETNTKSQSNWHFTKEKEFKSQDQMVDSKTLMNTQNKYAEYDGLNDTYSCDNSKQGYTKEYDIVDETVNYHDGKNVDMLINDRIKFRLEKLIQNHPDGIWCADLPKKYLEEYKVNLNYIELGFNSVREFTSHLPEIFHCVQPNDAGDFLLYYAKEEIPSKKIKERKHISNLSQLHQIYMDEDESNALPVMVSLDTCKELMPDDVMSIGENVGQLSVIDLTQEEKPYIEVIVVEVFTPSFFWVQLRKKQKVFKKFMDDLHNFYTLESERYKIPPVVLEKGLNCACKYNEFWHRGIIKTVKPDLQVTVMFYDYGTLKTYPSEAIYYLHRTFSFLPAQALPCGLVNTKPYNSTKWSRNATHQFAVRTSRIPLVATIASVNSEDNSMMITLTDTLEDDDLHINDWLVEQKLAEHGKMGDGVDMCNIMLYVEENLIYSPELCYEEETVLPNNDNKTDSKEETSNVPLVSPQSTLGTKPLKPPAGLTLSDDPINLQSILGEEFQDISFQNVSKVIDVSKHNTSNSTNPFLQDDSTYDHSESTITPQQFMQLWIDNLKLQMQISAAFDALLKKVIANSRNKKITNLLADEETRVEQPFNTDGTTWGRSDSTKDVVTLSKFLTSSVSQSYPFITAVANNYLDQKSGNAPHEYKYDFASSGCTKGNPILTTIDRDTALLSNTFSHGDLQSDNYLNSSQTASYQHAVQNFSLDPVTNVHNIHNAASAFFFGDESVSTKRLDNKMQNFDHGNNAMKHAKNGVTALENVQDFSSFKETNPFKLSLEGKLRISDSPEDDSSCTNSKFFPEPDLRSDFQMHRSKIRTANKDNTSAGCSYKYTSGVCEAAEVNASHEYFFPEGLYHNNSVNNNSTSSNNERLFTDYVQSMNNIRNGIYQIISETMPDAYNMNNRETEKCKERKSVMNVDNFNDCSFNRENRSNSIMSPKSQRPHCEIFSGTSVQPQINTFNHVKVEKQVDDFTLDSYMLEPRSSTFIDDDIDPIQEMWDKPEPIHRSKCHPSSHMNNNSLITSEGNYNCNAPHEFLRPTSNCDSKNVSPPSWLPINSFLSPLVVDNCNVDEGYLTRPSTSHTIQSSPPLVQPINILGSNQDSISWRKSVGDVGDYNCLNMNQANVSAVQLSSRAMNNHHAFTTYNELYNDQYNQLSTRNCYSEVNRSVSKQRDDVKSLTLKGATEFHIDTDDIKLRTLLSEKNELRNIWKSPVSKPSTYSNQDISSRRYSSPSKKLFFRKIELPRRSITIVHYHEEGWLLADEFVEAFTEFKSSSYMINFLRMLDLHVSFQEIERVQYPTEFAKLDSELPHLMRNMDNRVDKVCLIPLRSVLKVLNKLGIIARRDVSNAIVDKKITNGSITHEISMIINAYGEFQRFVGIAE